MTEGKLYQQIKDKIENAEWDWNERTLTYNISKVLDEAKQSFPSSQSVRTNDLLITHNLATNWEDLVKRYIEITIKRDEWFKHCFGEP
jgi:hypothetical protein